MKLGAFKRHEASENFAKINRSVSYYTLTIPRLVRIFHFSSPCDRYMFLVLATSFPD